MFSVLRLYIFLCSLILCTIHFADSDGANEIQKLQGHITRYRRQTSEGTHTFQCKSGQYIVEDLVCDGKADCSDDSDETVAECANLSCPRLTYRCKYGACVSFDARCNGVHDCFDGSDEENCSAHVTASSTPTLTNDSCLVPDSPPNGDFKVMGGSSKPGHYVPQFSVLVINCSSGYQHYPPHHDKFRVCIMGKWSSTSPTCARTCESINNTTATKVVCTYNDVQLDSCENPVEGTIAHLSCEQFYEAPEFLRDPIRVCKNGTWGNRISECVPECGLKRPHDTKNVIGGIINALKANHDYPWQVAIYDSRNVFKCGGTILNQRVVITAAHCFTPGDRLIDVENYTVAAGKYYREFDASRDEQAQYSKIAEIHLPQRYKGNVHSYEADLAVLIMKTKFNISAVVQPVCVDWDNEFEDEQLSGNHRGIVVGWGFTQTTGEPAEELRELTMPYISYNQCYEEVPRSFRKYLTHDKLCAGYYDEDKAVCAGDSGGGLIFRHSDNRYYIRGIVSTSPALDGNCHSNQYGTYTLISKHIDFINKLAAQDLG